MPEKHSPLTKALLAIRFIGLRNTLRSLRYTLYRDWAEWRYRTERAGPARHHPNSFAPIRVRSVQRTPNGAQFRYQNGLSLEVVFLAADVVRTTWQPGTLPLPYALAENAAQETPPAHAAIQGNPKPDAPSPFLAMRSENGAHIFSTPALTLTVHPDGAITYAAPHGPTLHHAHPPTLTPNGWTQPFDLQPREHIYGLGERAAPLNLRPGTYRFWNTDPAGSYPPGADPLYLTIPAFIGLHQNGSYLLFHENSHDGEIEFQPAPTSFHQATPAPTSSHQTTPVPTSSYEFLRETQGNSGNSGNSRNSGNSGNSGHSSRIAFRGGALRAYFIPGDLPRLLQRYTSLTGRAPLPPRWALGFHQSRWGYKSEADIREVAAGYARHDLPLSAIHLDIDYMRGYRVFTVDQSRFPDLSRLAADLDAQGVKLVAILDPGVKRDPDYDVYRQGLAEDVFCKLPGKRAPLATLVWPGWCAHPDFTNPKTRAWWARYYPRLLDQGIAGFWHDMNEPAAFASWGELTLPRPARHDLEGRGGDHLEAHNLYGLLMNRAGFEALRQHRPKNRPWLLSRSGWAGNQRYAWNWTGDNQSTWHSLRATIATVLNLGLSGIPYSGPDIGGFSGEPDAELFTRWFQMAALMPFFRVHSAVGTPPREPWRFGEPALSICREFLRLRQQLMPYLYTLAWEASQTGAPLLRPLFWIDPHNPKLWAVDDAFLLGSDLLVAPVLEPAARTRRIRLPAGRWYNFWRDDVLDESDSVETRLTPERIPILARGGSILPLERGEVLALHIYPDRDGCARGALYSDAGDGYAAWRVDRFEVNREPGAWVLSRSSEGDFPFPYAAIEVHLHNTAWPKRVLSPTFARVEW